MTKFENMENNKQIMVAPPNQFLPSFTDAEKKIVVASKSGRVFQTSTKDLTKLIFTAINESYLITGHKAPDETEVVIMAKQTTEFIKRELPNQPVDEIPIAMNKGAFGEFTRDGDITFISPQQIVTWLKRYNIHKLMVIKKQTEFEQQKQIEEMENEKRSKENKRFWNEFPQKVANEFDRWKNTSEWKPTNTSWLIYKTLDDIGLIPFTKDQKMKTFAKAKGLSRQEIGKNTPMMMRIPDDLIKSGAVRIARELSLVEWFQYCNAKFTTKQVMDAVKIAVDDNVLKKDLE